MGVITRRIVIMRRNGGVDGILTDLLMLER